MNLSRVKNFFENIVKRRQMIYGVVILVVLIFLLFSDHGIMKRISLQNKKREISEQISAEIAKKDSLQQEIKKMKFDTLEIERAARENYGLTKEGEKVFYIETNKKK